MPSVEVLTRVTFPCSQFIHSISSSLTGQSATGAGGQTPWPQSQPSQSPSGQSPRCSPSGLGDQGAPGAAVKSPSSFVPRGSEAACAPYYTQTGDAAPLGLPYLFPWTKGFLSSGKSACPSHPSPGLHHSSAPVSVFLLVAFNFLIGEQGRLQKC